MAKDKEDQQAAYVEPENFGGGKSEAGRKAASKKLSLFKSNKERRGSKGKMNDGVSLPAAPQDPSRNFNSQAGSVPFDPEAGSKKFEDDSPEIKKGGMKEKLLGNLGSSKGGSKVIH